MTGLFSSKYQPIVPMKHHLLLAACSLVLFAATSSAQSRVWRVDLDGYDADFTGADALQEAIDNVDVFDNDTIHVEGSAGTYNGVTMTRPLVLIGPGYFLNENTNPVLQANVNSAKVHSIVFAAGSNGSIITGLSIEGGFGTGITLETSDITIKRCKVSAIAFGTSLPTANIVIDQCYVAGAVGFGFGVGAVTNLSITNNYFGTAFTLANTHQGTVAHNVFANNVSVWGVNFFNNIVRAGTTAQNNNGIGNMYKNIFHDNPGSWLDGGTNYRTVNMATVFGNTGSTDGRLDPLPGCANCGNGFGTPPQEIGMFGGSTAYRLSGIPAIPSIYQLQAPPSAVQGETINVVLGTKSNN